MYLRKNFISIFILLILIYLTLFLHLTTQPVRIWDESRQAFNAYEMSESGDLLIKQYEHQPDLWNLKPPLLTWIQSGLMKIFGPYELSLRLPSAIAGLLTVLSLFIFLWKYFKRFWLGWIAALVTVTARQFVDYHGLRNGDYDALLVFFSLFYVLSFYVFLEDGKWKYFYFCVAGIILATMTKGIAGMFFLPALIIASVYYKKLKTIFSSHQFYYGVASFVIVIGGYYFLREQRLPGYLKAVMDNEWGGRFLNTLEQHTGSFWVYIENICTDIFSKFYLLIPCGFAIGMLDREKKFQRFTAYIAVAAVSAWLVLSASQTKLIWYIYPVIPFLSILIAIFIYFVFNQIKRLEVATEIRHSVLPFVFLLLVFWAPYSEMFNVVYKAHEWHTGKNYYSMSYYLRGMAKGDIKPERNVTIVFEDYSYHLDYYMMLINRKGQRVSKKPKEDLQPGDFVMCSYPEIDNYIQQHYETQPVEQTQYLNSYIINSRKF